MVLKLYGEHMSTKTRSVAQICIEKDVPFEFVQVDINAGEQKQPENIARHPFGQLPVIDDNGILVYESRACARYIAAKYAAQGTPGLIALPETTGRDAERMAAYAAFEQAAHVEVCSFEPWAYGVAWERVFKIRRGLKTDEARLQENVQRLEEKLDVYEGILGKQAYLAGDHVTLADLFHLPLSTMLEERFEMDVFKPEARPNVARWWKDISSRPSWLAVKNGV
ncbi:glutathione S-transferase [Coniophora puteana RWD-64-598 SS2]|uniref:glutathione transferase n=1 Tax=Coniophora puteana (strain RWD-64-598) TaxID=741705 RepID=A0A5M3N000_CONPW|nr:glutathione S-transferase [Coniophora puteana RWD-64-598 SS2]EIW84577.1 glutathione S-transferase [Coniophora puteana RWD-64-598 SS2]